MAVMSESSNQQNDNSNHPAPKLPAPKVPHVYVERGLWGWTVKKR
jgi:hypothetical protein